MSAYASQSWRLLFDFGSPAGASTANWQRLYFPNGGRFNISAAGASGSASIQSDRCRGALLSQTVNLAPNASLCVMIGQAGLWDGMYGGGGGGTFVVASNGTLLLAAGGGGGRYDGVTLYAGCDASITSNDGLAAELGDPGGTAGYGSIARLSTSCYGGAGFYSDYTPPLSFGGGTAPINGGTGGGYLRGTPNITSWNADSSYWLESGGFGGGGFVGGGGGFSGGGGFGNSFSTRFYMGGGGSYASQGLSNILKGYNVGDGYVTIQQLGY